MSIHAERALIGLLTDDDSLQVLLREGLMLDILPTEDLRPVVKWAQDYYASSSQAPSITALLDRWGEVLADNEIDPEVVVDESVEWAIDQLKASYVRTTAQRFSRNLVSDMKAAAPEDRIKVLAEASAELGAVVADLTPATTRVDMRSRGDRILNRYHQRAAREDRFEGLGFGLPEIDAHYGGIRPGEVCTVLAPAKHGKSFFLDNMAYRHWEAGNPTALFTLENSIEMTELRIASLATHIPLLGLDRGELDERDLDTLTEWINDVLHKSDAPLFILQPPEGQRTPQALVQQTIALECEAMLVDQLSFVEAVHPNKRDQPKAYEVADKMRMFRTGISTARRPISMALAHQIRREGIKEAEATGRLHMTGAADSSEVERASDIVVGLFASEDQMRQGVMTFQGLAFRRGPLRSYDLHWQIGNGLIEVRGELTDEDLEGFE